MGRLENIPKEQIFNVPADYFDKTLPAAIQSRIATHSSEPARKPAFQVALRYALPLVLVVAVLFYYLQPRTDAESILASVETDDLIMYLQESGMTTEDLLEHVALSDEDLEAIENEIYMLEMPGNDADVELNMP